MVEQVVINKEEPVDPATQETTAETTTEEVVAEDQQVEAGEKILGKFETQSDLEKAYKELESKVGQAKEDPKQDQGLEIQETAEKAVEAAGLDMSQLEQEFADNGELSEKSYEQLESQGISKDIVNNYIEGQQARAVQIETEIKDIAGGKDGYNEMIAWAKESLSQEEISAYNRVVNGRDLDATKMAVQGLKARMGTDAEPNLVRGKPALSQEQFTSVAQVTAAMSDPRYAKDPAFRQEVQAKIERSDVF
tara:strand:+ start:737 stop:1486 length:750 start_codon:yes stop_codon:yes gene_type:complete